MQAAAFFDLDRTLLRRSSALALAGAFREHGVIGRGQLAKAAAWQLLFAARGASAETVRKAAEDGLMVLKGFAVDDLRGLVRDAMEPVLKPLVYQEALELVRHHRGRGEPVYIVSATLQEIVEELADELGFDGALGSICESRRRHLHRALTPGLPRRREGGGAPRARGRTRLRPRRLDGVLGQPYRPAVLGGGREPRRGQSGPGAAADRRGARLARARLRRARLSAGAAAPPGAARDPVRARGGRGRLGGAAACGREPRIAALGFSEADTATLTSHFLDAESRGKLGHGLSRIDWLETLPDLDPGAQPQRLHAEPGYERWDGNGALGYLTLAAVVDAQLAEPPPHARVVVAANCFPTGMLGWYVRRLAEGGLVAALTATSPARLAHPAGGEPLAGTNPLAIAIPSSDGAPLVADVSMGAVTYGDVLRGAARPDELVPFGGEQAHKGFALALGLELLVGALAGEGFGAVLVVARPEADPVPELRRRAAGLRLPGDA